MSMKEALQGVVFSGAKLGGQKEETATEKAARYYYERDREERGFESLPTRKIQDRIFRETWERFWGKPLPPRQEGPRRRHVRRDSYFRGDVV